MVERGAYLCARKREDKRLSVELVEDAGCGGFAIIELESFEMCSYPISEGLPDWESLITLAITSFSSSRPPIRSSLFSFTTSTEPQIRY
jgi:hypothetical protein